MAGGRRGAGIPDAAPAEGLGLLARMRAYFLAGVLVTAPIGLTIYIAFWLVNLIDGWVRPFIPKGYLPDSYLPFSIPGLGVLIVVLALTLIGAFAAGYVGRLLLGWGEGVVARMPVVRSVYSAAKQVVETVFSKKSSAFREVVMLEYPRPGLWSLGFITGPAHPEFERRLGRELLHVFVPCAPPTAGYLVVTSRDELTTLDMSVEEGFKLVISGGIIVSPDADKRG